MTWAGGVRITRPLRRRGGGGQDIDGADPVVLLKGGEVQWWDCSTNILRCQGGLGGEAIGGEVFVNGSAKESPIDEKFERDWLGRLKKSIHERRERITAEV